MTKKESIHNTNWNNKISSKKTGKISESNNSLLLVLPKIKSALDVGCGTGELMRFLKKKGVKVLGTDISSSALKVAKQNGLNVKLADLDEKLPFKSNSFDACISNQVLMHVFDPEFVILEMKRVSKKYVVINVPNHMYWRFRISFILGKLPNVLEGKFSHIRLFSYSKIKTLIEKNNLKIIDEAYTGKSFLPQLFATGFTFVCKK
jgi:methionine biosynthesis protein MetW